MGTCKSKMGADIGKDSFKPSIDDTSGCDIDSVIDKSTNTSSEQAEAPHITTGKMATEERRRKGNLNENGEFSSLTRSKKSSKRRAKNETLQNMNQCDGSVDDCYYFPFGTNIRSFDHLSSDDDSSFSSNWGSTVHSKFHFDFENENIASGRKDSDSNPSESTSHSSSGSENTWSVWSSNTMRKCWNGTRSKKVKLPTSSDPMVSNNCKDGTVEQAERQGGYEYWYPNPIYDTQQPLIPRPSEFWYTFDNLSGGSFEEHDAVKTMRSAQFLDNPRQDFLILQKFLRNTRDDGSSLSVLLRLNEEGLLKKVVVHDCVENALHEKASRLEQTFRWLLEFHPTVLKERPLFYTFLSHCCSIPKDQCEAYWKRFLTLFEVGLSHYPQEIGFLFHRDYNKCFVSSPILRKCNSPFEMACLVFGREMVINAVDDIITRKTRCISELGSTISILVLAATTNPKITLDALYFLVRREPTSLYSLTTL